MFERRGREDDEKKNKWKKKKCWFVLPGNCVYLCALSLNKHRNAK